MLELLSQYGDALIGLMGVAVGGIIIGFREWRTQRSERRHDGSYSAIRLICILEDFAQQCVAVAGDDGYAYGRPARRTEGGEDVCEAQIEIPSPLSFPDDIVWRSVDETLMHRILALPNKVKSTNNYVSASSENAFPPEYEEFFEPRMEGYAKLGLEAFELIDDLRHQHGVKARSRTELSPDWDPKENLKDQLAQFAKRDADRAARRSTMPNPFPDVPKIDQEASKP